jgi:hypothetical protein
LLRYFRWRPAMTRPGSYARALLERHKHPESIRQLELLQRDPTNGQYKTLYATACIGVGKLRRHSLYIGNFG